MNCRIVKKKEMQVLEQEGERQEKREKEEREKEERKKEKEGEKEGIEEKKEEKVALTQPAPPCVPVTQICDFENIRWEMVMGDKRHR